HTPSTNSWAAGPTLPDGSVADDSPAAILPDGNVVFAADQPLFNSPTRIYEFNPSTNAITQLATPATLTTSLNGNPSFIDRMLMLPNGQLLFTDSTSQLWLYSESGTVQPSWRPRILGVA